MISRDTASRALDDLVAAFGLLTRLPLPSRDITPSPRAAWAWPVVGAALGAIAALAVSLALWAGLAPGIAAAIALLTGALLTGGLHEDGLADTADGLLGGRDRERRLDIMKDSRIGSYGALALILVTLIRWSALAALLTQGQHWAALIAVGALSRAPMAVLIATMPNARGTGLSHLTGQPPRSAALAACAIALILTLLATGSAMITMALATLATSLFLARAARARIGGQTGDILGASQQLAEAAALAFAAARLA